MSYLIELRTSTCPAAYVLTQADSHDHARALVDAELELTEETDYVEIVAVHTVH